MNRSPIAALLALTACKISYLPPASSRGDGGPVAMRGAIVHEARSQVRLYRDAAGCESVQTANRQFRVVTVTTDAGRERLVLEESYDVRLCLDSESSSSEATITAWLPDSAGTPPRFKISGRGLSGMPVGNLYRLMATGCCGSATLATYYSLITGKLLFTSTLPPLELRPAGGRGARFIGFHDTFSAIAASEGADSSVVGVLQSGDDREPARRLVLVSDRPEPYAIEAMAFSRGKSVLDSTVAESGKDPGLAVRLAVRGSTSGRRFVVTVPVDGDSLVPARAVLPPGVAWRR